MLTNVQGGNVRSALSWLSHEFAMRIWQAGAPPMGAANVCISPLSLYISLLMVGAGAEGQTKQELLALLGLGSASDGEIVEQFEKFRLDVFTVPEWMRDGHFAEWRQGSAIFCDISLPVNENFIGMCDRWFRTPIRRISFRHPESSHAMNAWAAEITTGRVNQLVPQVTPGCNLLVGSAVSFFDQWELPFSFEHSTYRPFYMSDGSQMRLEMMYRNGHQKYLETDHFQAVRLSYVDNRFCLYCFMPKPGASGGHILAAMAQPNWWKNFQETNLELWLPRFTLRLGTRYKEVLARAGAASLFIPCGNLTRIAPAHALPCLDDIVQQTYFRVDEVGPQTANDARRLQKASSLSAPRRTVSFDRPFLFLLRHEFAASPLYMGMVSRPE
jgi:serpin B